MNIHGNKIITKKIDGRAGTTVNIHTIDTETEGIFPWKIIVRVRLKKKTIFQIIFTVGTLVKKSDFGLSPWSVVEEFNIDVMKIPYARKVQSVF